jgi:glucose/arabinose dehydrogenase
MGTIPHMKKSLSTLFLITLLICGCSGGVRISAADNPEMSKLKLPPGFHIGIFASGLSGPRMMALSPDGRLFVTEMEGGRVTIFPDTRGMGKADAHITYASGLNHPHGIVFHNGYLYIAETTRVIRYKFSPGDISAPRSETIISGIPTQGHFTRTITFGPKDGKLYLSVGSSMNVGIERNPLRAAITRYNADGTGRETFASGIRNAVGLAWNPSTGDLWATINGRDYLGDNLPPDEVTIIRKGGFYGWPYAYGDRVPDPEYGRMSPAKVRETIPPTIPIQAHSAPLGLAFYTGSMFPAEYRGNLFVAYHGSWNRSTPTGYKVVRFVIQNGKPVGDQHDFITGWLQGGNAWGRPVGILEGKHGELYITDDTGGRVYRVTYGK